MTVFMLLVTETIPPTSEVVPLVAKFYMAAMFEMAFALVVTCYILRCYHSNANEVPDWMKRYIVGKLANFLGVQKSKALLKEEKEEENFRRLKNTAALLEKIMDSGMKRKEDQEDDVGKRMLNWNHNVAVDEMKKEVQEKLKNGCETRNAVSRHKSNLHCTKDYVLQNGDQQKEELSKGKNETSISTKRENMSDPIANRVLEKLEIISNNVQAKEKVDMVKEKWHIIAMVIDRISMWTFAVGIITTITITFYQSPGYVP